jgi:hypothetical protein
MNDDDLVSKTARTLMALAILRAADAGERGVEVVALEAVDDQSVVGSLP